METPILKQYYKIKSAHRGEVLFFRLGDFYEMFAEDAIEVSALLNLTLTERNSIPMCGIPHHASRPYIARLLKHGKKVAICEQIGEAQKGRGIIERKVVEVITPGTAIDEDYLERGESNYLASLYTDKTVGAFSYIDISTGEFFVTSFPIRQETENSAGVSFLSVEIERLKIKEIVVPESLLNNNDELSALLKNNSALVINRRLDWQFDSEKSWRRLEKQFEKKLSGFGLKPKSVEVIAAGVLLDYIDCTAGSAMEHIRSIKLYNNQEYTSIDEASLRNLELTRNLSGGDENCTLLQVLDQTKTGMGRRLLVRRLLYPLREKNKIEKRLAMVETFYKSPQKLTETRAVLGKIQDLERLCSRLATDRASPKDLLLARDALAQFVLLDKITLELSLEFESRSAARIRSLKLKALSDLKDLLYSALEDEAPVVINEGGIIQYGFSVELDKLRSLQNNGRKMLHNYLEEEKDRTDITTLKINFNRIIGYYFEVTSAHFRKVPSYFVKRQDLKSVVRYTTEKLSSLESEINGARDKIIDMERKLFFELRDKAKKLLEEIYDAAIKTAEIDVAASMATAASINLWNKPSITEQSFIEVQESRHPVVESQLPPHEFIPNDIFLGGKNPNFILITGPNMAGKSTYLRQCALIVIMAQMGSFVPTMDAQIGIVDKIYCRVGAQDNLARGESTFLVEMNEAGYILNTATAKSLVIMDEVGRGTSTNAGLAIAQAISEYLLDKIKCRTLFATHYHDLSNIKHKNLENYSMDVEEQDDKIIFKRRLKKGASLKSYGISVAGMAGLPPWVLKRAKEIEALLDSHSEVKPAQKKANDEGDLPLFAS